VTFTPFPFPRPPTQLLLSLFLLPSLRWCSPSPVPLTSRSMTSVSHPPPNRSDTHSSCVQSTVCTIDSSILLSSLQSLASFFLISFHFVLFFFSSFCAIPHYLHSYSQMLYPPNLSFPYSPNAYNRCWRWVWILDPRSMGGTNAFCTYRYQRQNVLLLL
jgi:hypothetical protein